MVRRPALLLVLVALIGACGDSGQRPDAAPASSTTASTTTAAPLRSCDPAAVDPAELEPAVEVDVPYGFERQPDELRGSGPSSFDEAVREEEAPDAAEALQASGFLRGYQRVWVNGSGVELAASVYEFCRVDGAQAHVDRHARLVAEQGILPAFVVADLPGARGHSVQLDHTAAVVLAPHDRFVVVVVATGSRDLLEVDDVEDLATDLAKALVAHLPIDDSSDE